MFRSVSTIRSDVAKKRWGATGRGIVWAVLDSGIDGSHPHFQHYDNLQLTPPLRHRDFVGEASESPLTDPFGHGTQVASIIAGGMTEQDGPIVYKASVRDDMSGEFTSELSNQKLSAIWAMAPECKLVSIKVINSEGVGKVSKMIAGLKAVQEMNGNGSQLRIHGVVIAVGYDYDPRAFACGQSPACVAVNDLVRSGVVVIVSAGNSGMSSLQRTAAGTSQLAQAEVSIQDPGNAELSITVGATHRDDPMTYGVSFFSSKGPTADGRMKPDLLAPGENIVAAFATKEDWKKSSPSEGQYKEMSGSSMASAHVAGGIAQVLSIRKNLWGQPGEVKHVILSAATDLHRYASYQGRGLFDVARTIDPTIDNTSETSIKKQIQLSYVYAPSDEIWKQRLDTHLASLKRTAEIETLQSYPVSDGGEWNEELASRVDQSQIVIVLVSPEFVASEFCIGAQLTRAAERHRLGTCVVVPVLVRATDFSATPIAKLPRLPESGKPLSLASDVDSALVDVQTSIRKMIGILVGPQH